MESQMKLVDMISFINNYDFNKALNEYAESVIRENIDVIRGFSAKVFTPYFNDGEPCVAYLEEIEFLLKKDFEETENDFEDGEDNDEDEDERYGASYFDNYWWKQYNYMEEDDVTDDEAERIKAIEKNLNEILQHMVTYSVLESYTNYVFMIDKENRFITKEMEHNGE